MNKKEGKTSGIGFTGLLTLLFITLKLTGFIEWSWFWVLSTIWISGTLIILLFFIIVLVELTKE